MVRMSAFEQNHRYIKRIAASAFNRREKTSGYFGPLRLTLRVFYNLDPIEGDDIVIDVDDNRHSGKEQPPFLFANALFRRGVKRRYINHPRCYLLMDIPRQNHANFNLAGIRRRHFVHRGASLYEAIPYMN
jgi:hypothetical protein